VIGSSETERRWVTEREMLWVFAGSSKAVGTSAKPRLIGGEIVVNKIVVAVTSATLLFCTIRVTGGQAKNGDKDSSHPAFKALNDSHASSTITLTELLDSYEEAVGGREAIEKIRTVVSHEERRSETKSGNQLLARSVVYFKFPSRAKCVLTLPNGSKDVTGYDGKIAWYDSPSEGIQRMPPGKNALAGQELNLFSLLHLRSTFPQMTLAGSSKIEGRDVYVVDASLGNLGLHRSLFFDAETRLLISSIVVQPWPDGTLIIEQIYSDFRAIHGVKFPFTLRAFEHVHQDSLEVKRTRIECNIPLRNDLFSVNSLVGRIIPER
jgi:hypothetical protein